MRRVADGIETVIVGKRPAIDLALTAFLAGGHLLIEDIPGVGKTTLAKALARALGLVFKRVQFTPDLLPADITGSSFYSPADGSFTFREGPVFANVVLADEINRTSPRTQSALLEVMSEGQVTTDGLRRDLPRPFFVVATQNPTDFHGTYPLPEAQLDRFLFKLIVPSPTLGELSAIVERTTGAETPQIDKVLDGPQIMAMRQVAREVPIASHVRDFAVRVVLATHPRSEVATPMVNQFVRFGASPRGAQALVLAAKIRALLDGRYNVAYDDLISVAPAALRHRLILNFEGEAEGIGADAVVRDILTRLSSQTAVAA